MIKSKQKYTSQKTSINKTKTPAIFKEVEKKKGWNKGSTNLDLGGGKYDTLSDKLLECYGIENFIYDPFNRSESHNENTLKTINSKSPDTVTISNVLNVIKEKDERLNILRNAYNYMSNNSTLFITVYEGNGSSKGSVVRDDQYQLNLKTKEYKKEISEVFPFVEIKGKLIICKK